jgi:hypothetical protein
MQMRQKQRQLEVHGYETGPQAWVNKSDEGDALACGLDMVAAISAACCRIQERMPAVARLRRALSAQECAGFLREGVHSILAVQMQARWLVACMSAYDAGLDDGLRKSGQAGGPQGGAPERGVRDEVHSATQPLLAFLSRVGVEHGRWVQEMARSWG